MCRFKVPCRAITISACSQPCLDCLIARYRYVPKIGTRPHPKRELANLCANLGCGTVMGLRTQSRTRSPVRIRHSAVPKSARGRAPIAGPDHTGHSQAGRCANLTSLTGESEILLAILPSSIMARQAAVQNRRVARRSMPLPGQTIPGSTGAHCQETCLRKSAHSR